MRQPSPHIAHFLLRSSTSWQSHQTPPRDECCTTPTLRSRTDSSAADAKLFPVSRESRDPEDILPINAGERHCSSQSAVRLGRNSARVCTATHLQPADKVTVLGHKVQNGRGWKGPLWVIQSNPPAESGSPTAGCIGPRPGGF